MMTIFPLLGAILPLLGSGYGSYINQNKFRKLCKLNIKNALCNNARLTALAFLSVPTRQEPRLPLTMLKQNQEKLAANNNYSTDYFQTSENCRNLYKVSKKNIIVLNACLFDKKMPISVIFHSEQYHLAAAYLNHKKTSKWYGFPYFST